MSALKKLLLQFQDIQALNKAVALLSWDHQVLMPKGGAEARAEHVGRLTRIAHDLLVSDETQRLVEVAADQVEPGTDEAATVRVMRRQLDIFTKIPTDLVGEKSRVS